MEAAKQKVLNAAVQRAAQLEYRVEFKGHVDLPGDDSWHCHDEVQHFGSAERLAEFCKRYSPTNESRILVRAVGEWRPLDEVNRGVKP